MSSKFPERADSRSLLHVPQSVDTSTGLINPRTLSNAATCLATHFAPAAVGTCLYWFSRYRHDGTDDIARVGVVSEEMSTRQRRGPFFSDAWRVAVEGWRPMHLYTSMDENTTAPAIVKYNHQIQLMGRVWKSAFIVGE